MYINHKDLRKIKMLFRIESGNENDLPILLPPLLFIQQSPIVVWVEALPLLLLLGLDVSSGLKCNGQENSSRS